MKQNKYPISLVCAARKNNLQKKACIPIKEDTLLVIIGYDGYHDYCVKFLPENIYQELNQKGPYFRHKDIKLLGTAAKILFDYNE